MDHKVVLITGASSGIGESLAIEWGERFPGDTLILAARRIPSLESLRNRLLALTPERGDREPASRVSVLPLDLESAVSIENAAAELERAGLVPDLVIHNAGISQRSLAEETALDVDRRVMEVNYFGTVHLTKRLLPAMLKRGSGQFAVVTSLVGKFGSPMRSGYAASKHALHGFFDSFRAELAQKYGPEAFPITLICPGFIRTQISMHALTRDGSPQQKMDESTRRGMDARACARRIVDAICAKKLEITVGGRETTGVLVKRLWPGLFARLIQKAKVT